MSLLFHPLVVVFNILTLPQYFAFVQRTTSSQRRFFKPQSELVNTLNLRGIEGIHNAASDPLAAKVLSRVPELARWDRWYSSPNWLMNGHIHTILASQLRATRTCRYNRELLATPDGGTLALDLLVGTSHQSQTLSAGNKNSPSSSFPCLSPCERCYIHSQTSSPVTRSINLCAASKSITDESAMKKSLFVDEAPPIDPSKPFLLLVSGLGGGSQDTYVRSMAGAAADRGWQVNCHAKASFTIQRYLYLSISPLPNAIAHPRFRHRKKITPHTPAHPRDSTDLFESLSRRFPRASLWTHPTRLVF